MTIRHRADFDRPRLLAVSAIALSILFSSPNAQECYAETPGQPEVLLRDLKSDDVSLNAYHAFEVLPRTPETERRMNQLLGSSDHQQRQYAAYYFVRFVSASAWPSELYQVMVDGLSDDGMDSFNSFANAKIFARMLASKAGNLSSVAVETLENGLKSEDLQQRQLSAAVLTQVYQQQARRSSTWPERFLPTVVEGLRADSLSFPLTIQNHRMFLNYLYFLEEGRPIALLQRELDGQDIQSKFGAAILLSKYLQGSVQSKVGAELVANLADDTVFANDVAAFQALVELGKPTAQTILSNTTLHDWQQAAYLQCLAAYFDIPWSVPKESAEQWYARATANKGWGRRLEIAALYLYPKSAEFLRGREIPNLLERLQKQGRSLRTGHDKVVWLGTWLWYLKPHPELWPIFSHSPYLDYSEFRLDLKGDYFNALEGIANIENRR